jgi:hypothetical protein
MILAPFKTVSCGSSDANTNNGKDRRIAKMNFLNALA